MEIHIKQGVWILYINDPFLAFCQGLWEVWQRWGDTPTITSGCEGQHMEGSLHYKGLAWDVRIWGIHDPYTMAQQLDRHLNAGAKMYDLRYGDEYHRYHIHVEYDPKER